jgi:hypothetical protein
MAHGKPEPAAWWQIRRATNRKPVSYRCPLCGQQLPALSEHMLMLPEGRPDGRRHAHTQCVLTARRQGRLPTRAEWLAAQRGPEAPSAWRKLLSSLRARVARRR